MYVCKLFIIPEKFNKIAYIPLEAKNSLCLINYTKLIFADYVIIIVRLNGKN